MAVRPPQNETDIAPWVLVGSVPVAALAWWLWQVPAVALLWILVVAACWFSQPPILTGKKDRTGRVQPASTAEQKSMSRHEMFRAGRFSLIVPQISSIGWPPLMASITALLTGVAAWFLPVSAPFQVVWPLFPALNAWGAFALALQVPAIARQFADDVQPRPGLDLPAVWKRLTSGDLRTTISLGCGVLAAASVVVAGCALGPKVSFLSSLFLGLACVPLSLQVGLHRPVIAHWRDMVDGRAQWAPRWEVLKLDPAPRLVDRSRLPGDVATIDTFDAPPEVGSRGMFTRLQDFETLVDPGTTVALLIEPNLDSQGQPVPSTSHPTRFRVITWFTDDWPAVSAAETDDDIRQLVIETVASRAAYAVQKLPPLVLEQLAPITDPPSQRDTDDGFDDTRAAFGTVWRSPANPDVTVSVLMELGILDRVAAELGCEIIADPENDCAYLGALTEPPIARIQPRWVHRFDELAKIRRWDQRWTDIVKQGGRKPVLQPSTEREYQYRHIDRRTGAARSITVGTWGFVTPQGVTPAEFTNQDTEHKLKTTLKAAPFASVQPWKDPASRDGRAHSEAFMVVSVPAGTDLPTLPQDYVPAGRGNEPQRLILAGFLSHAFDACRLARPHLTKLTALTTATSSGTIWRMDIFLGAGVTLDALRKQSEKIRQTLGAEWLIVDRAETGRATIVVGAAPGADGIEYATPADRNREYVTSLNWQQVFIAAKVVSENGAVPSLVSAGVLPHNDRVQDLTFKLPMGLAPADVREKVGKLRAASSNDFIDIRDSETGPDHVRMLVCRENPLPKGVPYDFELVDRLADEGCVPFAMGVEGEPVIFDPKDGHAMLAGVSGAGKAQSLSTRLPVPISERFPDGWATIGTIQPGDHVYAPDGSVQTVRALSPIRECTEYTLVLSDGRRARSGGNHLWTVQTASARRARTPGSAARRDSVVADERARLAQRLRGMAEQTPAGQVATRQTIAQISGVSLSAVCRILPESLALAGTVTTRRPASLYDARDARQAVIEHGRLCPPLTESVTVSQLSELLFGESDSRNRRKTVRGWLRGLDPVGVSEVQRQRVSVYPVDEALTLLADSVEHRTRTLQPLNSIVSMQEIVEAGVLDSRGAHNWAIQIASSLQGQDLDLPVAPYTLGAWLGDGSKRGPSITGLDEGVLHNVLTDGYVLRRTEGKSGDSRAVTWHFDGLRPDLVSAGFTLNPDSPAKQKWIPRVYQRASKAQRLALLQGLMDTDGTVDVNGACEICLTDERLIQDVLELIRGLGIRASLTTASAGYTRSDGTRKMTGNRYRIAFTTLEPVFRLTRKLERLETRVSERTGHDLVFVTDIIEGDVVPMRCLMVTGEHHTYLTEDLVPTHNSVLAQTFLTSAAAHGEIIYVIDPMKGGADFNFVRPYAAAFADSIETAAAALKCVYAQVVERKNLNAAHGAPSFSDLPEALRPKRIWVMVDEFTSLLGKEPVPDASSDPEEMAERDRMMHLNQDKASIGILTGKIAREARSAGVTLLLGTQKLSAKTLDAIPGGDLKTNLARSLLGKASYGDKMSALRNPDDAPELGAFIPKGRGLWEPLVGPTQVIQVWYAPQEELARQLAARRDPLPDDERSNLEAFIRKESGPRLGVLEEDDGTTPVEVVNETPVIEDVGIVEEVDIADDLASFFNDVASPETDPEPTSESSSANPAAAPETYDDF
ncbi:hypothetical protein F8O06_04840 [Pseudoclavibacter sp. CFCC 14310]|uniref:LAGLIDADG family homing endonuclease n=1 Tax=Pseudoclavibacter sp. CFCC 14310 TaxID=2615180 RepID=UPI0013019181|nr:LAGLIDADG family homing endonuclease [Pseudoclavibacter sp. CFCC 14310]KAB1645448.1 hypothetical protein F8O06_07605 [Pseudoclavibacter sp. CFCC 14310]KAB1646093.1 hypothetical protein F8O06_04840 [Pseudoclavibacter sp. CFCC 14310]